MKAVQGISRGTLCRTRLSPAGATTPVDVAVRSQVFAATKAWVQPLPFDGQAAEKYGEMAALVLAAGRQPRPRRFNLMIAAIAAVRHLPLYTANPDDFRGLQPVITIVAVSPGADRLPSR